MKDHLEDIKEIRNMMERSSRFMSLSGTSGLLIGGYTIVYAFLLHYLYGIGFWKILPYTLLDLEGQAIFLGANVLLAVSLLTSTVLTVAKTKKLGQKVWTATSKELMISLMLPLVAGVSIIGAEIYRYDLDLFFPLTLVFYGLGLFGASRYTFKELRFMGALEVVLGILAMWMPAQALVFWTLGFGFLHLVYGLLMSKR